MNRGERRAALHYRLHGYRVVASNVRVGGVELDLVVRRGRRLVIVEVKQRASERFGGPFGAVGREKQRRLRRGAAAWLAAHHEGGGCDVVLEVAAVSGPRMLRLRRAELPPE